MTLAISASWRTGLRWCVATRVGTPTRHPPGLTCVSTFSPGAFHGRSAMSRGAVFVAGRSSGPSSTTPAPHTRRASGLAWHRKAPHRHSKPGAPGPIPRARHINLHLRAALWAGVVPVVLGLGPGRGFGGHSAFGKGRGGQSGGRGWGYFCQDGSRHESGITTTGHSDTGASPVFTDTADTVGAMSLPKPGTAELEQLLGERRVRCARRTFFVVTKKPWIRCRAQLSTVVLICFLMCSKTRGGRWS